MKRSLVLGLILGSGIISLFMFSCKSVGYAGQLAGGKRTTFEGTYVLENKGSIELSMSKLKTVLYADGWNKTNENGNTLLFEVASSKDAEKVLGKINTSTIKAVFTANEVKLQITQRGNFKFGTETKVNKTFIKIEEQYNQDPKIFN